MNFATLKVMCAQVREVCLSFFPPSDAVSFPVMYSTSKSNEAAQGILYHSSVISFHRQCGVCVLVYGVLDYYKSIN